MDLAPKVLPTAPEPDPAVQRPVSTAPPKSGASGTPTLEAEAAGHGQVYRRPRGWVHCFSRAESTEVSAGEAYSYTHIAGMQ
jgi:hypothetical protein